MATVPHPRKRAVRRTVEDMERQLLDACFSYIDRVNEETERHNLTASVWYDSDGVMDTDWIQPTCDSEAHEWTAQAVARALDCPRPVRELEISIRNYLSRPKGRPRGSCNKSCLSSKKSNGINRLKTPSAASAPTSAAVSAVTPSRKKSCLSSKKSNEINELESHSVTSTPAPAAAPLLSNTPAKNRAEAGAGGAAKDGAGADVQVWPPAPSGWLAPAYAHLDWLEVTLRTGRAGPLLDTLGLDRRGTRASNVRSGWHYRETYGPPQASEDSQYWGVDIYSVPDAYPESGWCKVEAPSRAAGRVQQALLKSGFQHGVARIDSAIDLKLQPGQERTWADHPVVRYLDGLVSKGKLTKWEKSERAGSAARSQPQGQGATDGEQACTRYYTCAKPGRKPGRAMRVLLRVYPRLGQDLLRFELQARPSNRQRLVRVTADQVWSVRSWTKEAFRLLMGRPAPELPKVQTKGKPKPQRPKAKAIRSPRKPAVRSAATPIPPALRAALEGRLTCPEGKPWVRVWDTGSGLRLYLQIGRRRRTWYVSDARTGNPVRLGHYPAMTLKQAREAARKRARLCAAGKMQRPQPSRKWANPAACLGDKVGKLPDKPVPATSPPRRTGLKANPAVPTIQITASAWQQPRWRFFSFWRGRLRCQKA